MSEELNEMQKLINHLRKKPQELFENIGGWKRAFKSDACLAADMIESLRSELAAERAKVKRLEAMRDQMMNGCEGHCALDECVCEKDQRVVDLQDELNTERAKVNELEAQNAVMREALEYAERTLLAFARKYTEQTDQADPLKNFDFDAFGNLRAKALTDANRAQQALSLTPSDAAEMVIKKDELLRNVVRCMAEMRELANNGSFRCQTMAECDALIEAARAAGVEV